MTRRVFASQPVIEGRGGPSAQVRAFAARFGGTAVEITDDEGTPLASNTAVLSAYQLPEIQGPDDGTSVLWLEQVADPDEGRSAIYATDAAPTSGGGGTSSPEISCWLMVKTPIVTTPYQPVTLTEHTGGSHVGGVNGWVNLGAGQSATVYARLADPLTPLEIGYAEFLLVSPDGTEQLGSEADSGLTLTQEGLVDWTGFSTFGAVGTDLAADADGITSTAGGLFLFSLTLWVP